MSSFQRSWPHGVLCGFLMSIVLPGVAASADFELQTGDRVVFLGDGLIEQEQYFGWVELMLTTSFPDQDVSFRNLGWSGDTPAGASRFGLSLLQAGNEPTDEGWRQLQKQIELTQPTVLFVGYGMASALENGPQGAVQFKNEYERLLRKAQEVVPNIEFVLLSPLQQLSPTPVQAEALATHRRVIQDLAEQFGAHLIDLTGAAYKDDFRKDPIHLNGTGYKVVARDLARQLGLTENQWETSPHSERLRKTIVRKNQWWFHRSRPANMAYVFGFRKHEQGQNAVEIPQFDGLIAKEEARIAKLRQLETVDINPDPPRLDSKYAEFQAQALPEFVVGDELEITLWAQDPLLNKPIHMNFDPQGRLWIASSEAYPMIEVGQAAPDKIIVLEDTTGDGRADKSQVFAEGLLIPTGVAPGDGGVYVAQSTDLLHLRDTDGDGKADIKRRVLSGFGTEDTHHNLHTLRWGPDGRLYMNQSVYTRSDLETPHGVIRLKAGGGFRYDTQTMRMQIFFRGLWNSWGHQFDSYGQSFLTDGAGFAGIAYAFPGATFNPTPQARHLLDLISPGNWPKFASLEIIGGNSFPPAWQGSLITCDFRANRVTRFSVAEQGAGFVTTQEPDVVRTSAATFRPIDVKQGPDGALYIADWSNPIINHGEVDFRDPRRDRWHGRIWRVSWKEAPRMAIVDYTHLETAALFELLAGGDRAAQDQARRVLIERGDQVLTDLKAWLAEQTEDEARLRALWLHQAFDVPNVNLLDELLKSPDGRVRAAATRVLSDWADGMTGAFLTNAEAIKRLEKAIMDEHPRVRLEAIRGVANLKNRAAARLLVMATSQPLDRFLQHALALSVHDMAEPLMDSIESEQIATAESDGVLQLLQFLLMSVDSDRASRFLLTRLTEDGRMGLGNAPWLNLIARVGDQVVIDQVYELVLDRSLDDDSKLHCLYALRDSQRLRKKKPSGDLTEIIPLLNSSNNKVQTAVVELASVWQLADAAEEFIKLASAEEVATSVRVAALRALANNSTEEAVNRLTEFALEMDNRELRLAAIASLATIKPREAVEPFYAFLQETESEETALTAWQQVLTNPQMGEQLTATFSGEAFAPFVVAAGERAASRAGRRFAPLHTKLAEHVRDGQVTTSRVEKATLPQLTSMIESGNPAKGELIYRRADLACSTCHAIGGAGGKVGPDLTSLGTAAPLDYLRESLFDPNAKIKEGFHTVTITTEFGNVIEGVEAESTDLEVIVRDANNELIRIPRAEVLDLAAGKSLMPEGTVNRLSEKEQIDLLAFLSRLGKPGPYDASQGSVARSVEVFAGTHRIEQLGADRIISGEITDGWIPLNAMVNGDLPKSMLQEVTEQPINIALVHIYVRAYFVNTSNQEVVFRVPASASLWIDGEPVQGKNEFRADIAPGNHEVLVRLDARGLPESFRLESTDVKFVNKLSP